MDRLTLIALAQHQPLAAVLCDAAGITPSGGVVECASCAVLYVDYHPKIGQRALAGSSVVRDLKYGSRCGSCSAVIEEADAIWTS